MKLAFDNGGYLDGGTMLSVLIRKCPERLNDIMSDTELTDITFEKITLEYRGFLKRSFVGLSPSERREIERKKPFDLLSDILYLTEWDFEIHVVQSEKGFITIVLAGFYEKGLKKLEFYRPEAERTMGIIRGFVSAMTGTELTRCTPCVDTENVYARLTPYGEWCLKYKRREKFYGLHRAV